MVSRIEAYHMSAPHSTTAQISNDVRSSAKDDDYSCRILQSYRIMPLMQVFSKTKLRRSAGTFKATSVTLMQW